jgi:hypothetical protein
MNDLLTPAEAASHLGGSAPLSQQTLAQWRSADTGPAYLKVGGQVRYRRADLDRWLDQQRQEPQRAA